MKTLSPTDYRNDINKVDKYGRRKCSNCNKRRLVNAYWKDTNKVLCKECSTQGSTPLAYSLRSSK